MTQWRLPIVNQDDAVWGDILVQYLKKEHYDNGTDDAVNNGGHKTITVRAGTATANTAPIKIASGVSLTTPEAGAIEYTTDTLSFTVANSGSPARKKVVLEPGGATGDTLYRDSTGNFNALAAVAVGKSLRSAGTSTPPAWADLAQIAATGQTATKSASYTINNGSNNDVVIFADNTSGAVTITLPLAASYPGYRFYVKRIDNVTANVCTIARSGSDTIDGATSQTLDLQYTAIAVVSNGSNWYIL